VGVPDYSRFALDSSQQAAITLTLKGVNCGFIAYSKIDATRLKPLYPHWIAAGGGAQGLSFPQMTPTVNSTTTFEMKVNLPQSLHVAAPAEPETYVRREFTVSSDRAFGLIGHELGDDHIISSTNVATHTLTDVKSAPTAQKFSQNEVVNDSKRLIEQRAIKNTLLSKKPIDWKRSVEAIEKLGHEKSDPAANEIGKKQIRKRDADIQTLKTSIATRSWYIDFSRGASPEGATYCGLFSTGVKRLARRLS
jgi:hypothetical protein